MINLKRSPERKIEHANSDCFERIGKRRVAFGAEALAPQDHCNAGQQSQRDLARGADPAIVQCVLDEIGDANQDGDDSDAIEPKLADFAFESLGVFLWSDPRSNLPYSFSEWCPGRRRNWH